MKNQYQIAVIVGSLQRDSFNRKLARALVPFAPPGVLGVSVGSAGTALAQQHLRNILAFLDVPTLCQPEAFIQMKDGLFDEECSIGAASKQFLQNWMQLYLAWVKKHVL